MFAPTGTVGRGDGVATAKMLERKTKHLVFVTGVVGSGKTTYVKSALVDYLHIFAPVDTVKRVNIWRNCLIDEISKAVAGGEKDGIAIECYELPKGGYLTDIMFAAGVKSATEIYIRDLVGGRFVDARPLVLSVGRGRFSEISRDLKKD